MDINNLSEVDFYNYIIGRDNGMEHEEAIKYLMELKNERNNKIKQ